MIYVRILWICIHSYIDDYLLENSRIHPLYPIYFFSWVFKLSIAFDVIFFLFSYSDAAEADVRRWERSYARLPPKHKVNFV
jgi:hypothetical protein